jgi:hypothetical protein
MDMLQACMSKSQRTRVWKQKQKGKHFPPIVHQEIQKTFEMGNWMGDDYF